MTFEVDILKAQTIFFIFNLSLFCAQTTPLGPNISSKIGHFFQKSQFSRQYGRGQRVEKKTNRKTLTHSNIYHERLSFRCGGYKLSITLSLWDIASCMCVICSIFCLKWRVSLSRDISRQEATINFSNAYSESLNDFLQAFFAKKIAKLPEQCR